MLCRLDWLLGVCSVMVSFCVMVGFVVSRVGSVFSRCCLCSVKGVVGILVM